MISNSRSVQDFNSEIDYDRAVSALKRRAGALYRQYQGAKRDPMQSHAGRQEILRLYGEAIEATKTLSPDDHESICRILSTAA